MSPTDIVLRKDIDGTFGALLLTAVGAPWLVFALIIRLASTFSATQFALSIGPPVIVLTGGLYFLSRSRHRWTDTLTINDSGVHVAEAGGVRSFSWEDLGRIRTYRREAEDRDAVVVLERRGEFVYVPAINDICGFPMAAEDLASLIRERKALFEDAAQAAMPGPT